VSPTLCVCRSCKGSFPSYVGNYPVCSSECWAAQFETKKPPQSSADDAGEGVTATRGAEPHKGTTEVPHEDVHGGGVHRDRRAQR
jgi:hypothetical protein